MPAFALTLRIVLLLSHTAAIYAQAPRPNGKGALFLEPLLTATSDPKPTDPEPIPTSRPPESPSTPSSPSQQIPSPSPSASSSSEPSPEPSCNTYIYRTLTGKCTSAVDASIGGARRPLLTFFRTSTTNPVGTHLKSPRQISNIIANQTTDVFNRRRINQLFVFFGQFIDHNIAATPLTNERMDIHVSNDDPTLPPVPLHFRHSERALDSDGLTERPINTLPSAFDLSAVYGPNKPRNRALREPNSPKLRTSPGNMLPFNTQQFNNAPSPSNIWYFAGDHRVNEHPVLTSFHTIFLREHNRLCDIVQRRYRSYSHQQIYDIERSINIAQFQKIVYEEFYPAITGRKLPRYYGHRKSTNPTLSDLFSTAAFRIGHTMIVDMVTSTDSNGHSTMVSLRDLFFRPSNVRDGIERFLRGAAQTIAQEVDLLVVNSLCNFLFKRVNGEEGFDLSAMNIQRARDHGIPNYNQVRRWAGLRGVKRFSQISKNRDVQARLAQAYDTVDDVETWVGILAEDHMRGASIGPTMHRLWRQEFTRLRDGDQFFYKQQKAIPRKLLKRLWPTIRRRLSKRRSLLKELIVKNSDVKAEDLPRRKVFIL